MEQAVANISKRVKEIQTPLYMNAFRRLPIVKHKLTKCSKQGSSKIYTM